MFKCSSDCSSFVSLLLPCVCIHSSAVSEFTVDCEIEYDMIPHLHTWLESEAE